MTNSYIGLEYAPERVTLSPPTLSPQPLPQSSSSLSTISTDSPKRIGRPRSASSSSRNDPIADKKRLYVEKMKQREKMLYNDAVECPICFLVSCNNDMSYMSY